MIKKIGILTLWEFPEGMAPTTRILAYSKGLFENGIEVEIFSFKRIFKDEIKNEKIDGFVNGVKYTYLNYFHAIGKQLKLIRIFDELILRLKLLHFIWRSNSQVPFDCFFVSCDDIHSFRAYLWIFRIIKIPLIFVADEFPIPIRDFMRNEVPEKMLLEYKCFHKLFSARMLMSKTLKDFYNDKIFESPTFILNTIVDTTRFQIEVNNRSANKPYICYMGNMDLRKDNVENIIHAFSMIEKKHPEIELHLYGLPSSADYNFLNEKVGFFNLKEKVIFKGRASYLEVPRVLKGAIILVNSQPITKRAEGGFPTKLGEYLLSNRPSVFTNSGDISIFINNEEHAYIVEPENPKAFSLKLEYILENYEAACTVADSGYRYILENFDAKNQTKELILFLNNLLSGEN